MTKPAAPQAHTPFVIRTFSSRSSMTQPNRARTLRGAEKLAHAFIDVGGWLKVVVYRRDYCGRLTMEFSLEQTSKVQV